MGMRCLVAIPVYNEQRHLEAVLDEVRRFLPDALVVDDGSTDRTPDILRNRAGVAVVGHDTNRGYGASLASAFWYARHASYDWLITMDCDGQHEPVLIPDFIRLCESDEYDIISGSRYLQPCSTDRVPPDRQRINADITRLLNERLGMNLTDAFCGYKAYRVSALNAFEITIPGYAMPLQLWVQARRAELRVVELPVSLIYNDPSRHFGGELDDPAQRLRYYLEVLDRESAVSDPKASVSSACGATAA